LHSLTGLIPVGAYMIVHLVVNLTALEGVGGPSMYQKLVYQIHGFGGLLPVLEWTFIFGPILFHGIIGLLIIREALPNTGSYPFPSNIRYSLQRITGIVAFVFILYHVFQMHGWFHFQAWQAGVVEPLAGAQFKPFNAASSLGRAMQGFWIPAFYVLGLAACVFHLANGLWTMGITWGIWTSPKAQNGALYVCGTVGVVLGVISLGALIGAMSVDEKLALEVEQRMFDHKVASGEIDPRDGAHKRWQGETAESHRELSASRIAPSSLSD
jgi:succinate dehydrogenase / fumarate reductase cytochrome b subunit